MRDYNKWVGTGRITKDVVLRTTTGGTSVADGTLATNHKFGETDEVSFVDLVFWGQKAEFASKFLTKGKAVLVEGRLQQQRWEKDGEKRSKMVVVIEDVTFLPGNKIDDKETSSEKPAKTTTEKKGAEIPF